MVENQGDDDDAVRFDSLCAHFDQFAPVLLGFAHFLLYVSQAEEEEEIDTDAAASSAAEMAAVEEDDEEVRFGSLFAQYLLRICSVFCSMFAQGSSQSEALSDTSNRPKQVQEMKAEA